MSKEYFPFFNLLYTAVMRGKIEEKTRDNSDASNEWVFRLIFDLYRLRHLKTISISYSKSYLICPPNIKIM